MSCVGRIKKETSDPMSNFSLKSPILTWQVSASFPAENTKKKDGFRITKNHRIES